MYLAVRLIALGVLAALGIWYLGFSDTGIEPVAYEVSEDPGFTGRFAPNERLAVVEILDMGEEHGPEDIAVDADGTAWVTSEESGLWRLADRQIERVGRLGGRPLGLEFGADGGLYIADSYLGLLRWTEEGGSEVLADEYDGHPIRYANQVAPADDGSVYFSVSTTRHDPEALGGTLPSSVIDLWEHRTTGHVLRWREGALDQVARGFSFANGIALTPEEDALLIAETGSYRIWRLDLASGERRVIVDALPGFPDNIQAQGDGTYWVGLVSPRRPIADRLAGYPFVRDVVWRLPEAVRPAPVHHGILMRIDGEGEILDVLQAPQGEYSLVTGGVVIGETLYVTSLGADGVGVMDAP
ncbi:SMP-30/gluconolactonase/LRE family protein [Roseobacter sp. HKCCA0434]|uniref:SMP-30/gluconolactonase/LRE family protein n=1 Tax=Roseobacter sp. HKCCA0434 TaxID=3079297 RepID=UPI0029057E04|nr:SMP-30/gluconolactonase/LRE family protein [Roseobacter sp. HKCCA0434]